MLDELATAEAIGVPVSVIRAGAGTWQDSKNRELAVAHTIYKRNLHRCGHSVEKAFSGSISGYVQTQWVKCYVCEAAERAAADLPEGDERHGRAWSPIAVDHFPYDDPDESFTPYSFRPRELDI